jgi:hypothetical protein
LPDFSWCNLPKLEKIYPITITYTKWPQKIPSGRNLDQMAVR